MREPKVIQVPKKSGHFLQKRIFAENDFADDVFLRIRMFSPFSGGKNSLSQYEIVIIIHSLTLRQGPLQIIKQLSIYCKVCTLKTHQ